MISISGVIKKHSLICMENSFHCCHILITLKFILKVLTPSNGIPVVAMFTKAFHSCIALTTLSYANYALQLKKPFVVANHG